MDLRGQNSREEEAEAEEGLTWGTWPGKGSKVRDDPVGSNLVVVRWEVRSRLEIDCGTLSFRLDSATAQRAERVESCLLRG